MIVDLAQGIQLLTGQTSLVVSDDLEKRMTNKKADIANDATESATPLSSPKTAQASDKKTFISEERRVQDALEDDEVREALRASHKPGKAAK
jgi:hypothetical protein